MDEKTAGVLSSFSLEGKVALVTGASYGIGFAIATALAEAGAKIAFNDRRQERIDSATAEYAKRDWSLLAVSASVPVLGASCEACVG